MKTLTINFLDENVTTPEEMAVYLDGVKTLLEYGYNSHCGRVDFEYSTDLY